MKRTVSGSLLFALVGVLTAVMPAAAQQQTAQKIAFINSQQILKAAPGFALAESTFNREMETFRAQGARLQATLDSAATAFSRDGVLLSPSAREAKRKELETQQTQTEQRLTELRDRSIARQNELLDPITTRIQTVIDGIRAEGNYAIILDITVLGSGIVSADRSLDLTETVIRRLQAGS